MIEFSGFWNFNTDKINNKNYMLRYALSDKFIFLFPQSSELTVGPVDILKDKTTRVKVLKKK
jgi:hypothetical protein